VSLTNLSEYDEFRHLEGDYSLVGLRSGRKFRMGDKVRIKVVAANLTKRQLDYEWVIGSGANEEPMQPGEPRALKPERGVIPPGKSRPPRKKKG